MIRKRVVITTINLWRFKDYRGKQILINLLERMIIFNHFCCTNSCFVTFKRRRIFRILDIIISVPLISMSFLSAIEFFTLKFIIFFLTSEFGGIKQNFFLLFFNAQECILYCSISINRSKSILNFWKVFMNVQKLFELMTLLYRRNQSKFL